MKIYAFDHIFRAFRNRNYALFFAGQSVSQVGTWVQRTAVIWVIYNLTHSAAMIGVAIFAQLFPAFLFSLFGGVVADRYSRYKILLVTQSASMIQSVLLALLIISGRHEIWEILALGTMLGIINAFDVPAMQPLVHELIENKEDLANAISLNSAMINMARLIGPAISGMVLHQFGAGICFTLNAVSFLAVITSLLMMKFAKQVPPPIKKKASYELTEGFIYLKQTSSISIILLLLFTLSLLVLPFDTMLPVFAKVIFKGNAATYGYISGFIGLGALAGSFLLAAFSRQIDLKKLMLLSVTLLGIGLIVFSRMTEIAFSVPFAFILGLGSMTPMFCAMTIVQTETAVNMRGRVISFMAMAYFGMLPVGSLLVGYISQKTGAPFTMLCQGIIALGVAALFSKLMLNTKPALVT